MKPVLILGIGNILLRDEGVGVRVVEQLAGRTLPDGVEALDGGTSGVDLVDDIAGRRKLIVIDAMDAEQAPGTVCRMRPEDLLADDGAQMSLHQFGLADTLMMARQLGCYPGEVVIFGVQPADVRSGLELSPQIEAAMPKLLDVVLAEAGK